MSSGGFTLTPGAVAALVGGNSGLKAVVQCNGAMRDLYLSNRVAVTQCQESCLDVVESAKFSKIFARAA